MDRRHSLLESDSFDDDTDDFLFGSIHRYDTLQMFTLENVPVHVLQSDETSLCVTSRRSKGQNFEILKLKLPEKLMLPPEEEGRSKENDFKVLCGIYTENEVYQIDQHKGKLITSENNDTGLNIYTFNDGSLGNKNQHEKLNVTPWTQSEFTVIRGSAHVVCSKSCHEPLIEVDLSTGEVVKEFKHSFESSSNVSNDSKEKVDQSSINNLKCLPLSNDLIAVLNTNTGEVVLHDLRSEGSFVPLSGISLKLKEEVWTLSGYDYQQSYPESLNYFGVISNATSFCIYDRRKLSVLTEKIGRSMPLGDLMKLKFNRDDKFSISGMNSFVEIYRINGTNFEHIFTHTGHCPGQESSDLVTDHIWLQAGGKEYIVSICSNSTLNCWDFKV